MDYVRTPNAPVPLGPYEQAVVHGGTVYVAMQLPLSPGGDNGALAGIEEQAELVLKNIKVILEAAGSSMEKTLRVTVYLKDIGHSKRLNAIYEKYFHDHKPARAVIGVAALPMGYSIAMDAIAAI